MPRRNRNAWRNDQARAEIQQDGLFNLEQQRRRRRGKRGRRLEQRKRAA
jgi:hypothetical protein